VTTSSTSTVPSLAAAPPMLIGVNPRGVARSSDRSRSQQ
jgi:hypothetical protein